MRKRSVSFPATRTDTDEGAEGGPVASDTAFELLHPSVLQAKKKIKRETKFTTPRLRKGLAWLGEHAGEFLLNGLPSTPGGIGSTHVQGETTA